MKTADKMYHKVEEVLFTDKLKVPTEISKIISSEIGYILSQYFDIKKQSFRSSIVQEKNGDLDIYFSFKANWVLIKKTLSDS